MPAMGTTTVDFGAGANRKVSVRKAVAVGGTWTQAEAWVHGVASADHSSDEHMVENLKIELGKIVANTSFEIFARCTRGRTNGVFNISWGVN
jgi:ribosomal protein S9